MSHPDDMSPQEDIKVGCFVFTILGLIVFMAVSALLIAIYFGVTML